MTMESIDHMEIRKILTDSDLDGVLSGAILLRRWPDAEVIFGHPGALKNGLYDDLVDQQTAICDLPYHPKCGLSIDHHLSNKPDSVSRERVWEAAPSAARVAANLLAHIVNLDDLSEALEWTDRLDGGRVTRDQYLSEEPMVWIGRSVGVGDEIARAVMWLFYSGLTPHEVSETDVVKGAISQRKKENEILKLEIEKRLEIVDRLAIVRMHGLGMRSNGYAVTAFVGDACDACLITHGDLGVSFGEGEGYPVSASFYTNSFLHKEGGIFDLTTLATRFDPDGGGHKDACGCRIKPLDGSCVVDRNVTEDDVELNIRNWIGLWSQRM